MQAWRIIWDLTQMARNETFLVSVILLYSHIFLDGIKVEFRDWIQSWTIVTDNIKVRSLRKKNLL